MQVVLTGVNNPIQLSVAQRVNVYCNPFLSHLGYFWGIFPGQARAAMYIK